ncbi:BTB/POZ domain-containing protein 6-like [Mercenaria mercenaria]|uniref:BTB/POZ domain-containing protein 6-like n=1 Tax=Mercenaria mercenaria TaxID=6596 RepID=UPI00234F9995|nr:BTB/POZ domain-containing protein 6-like [Mercenaria mercenaria]
MEEENQDSNTTRKGARKFQRRRDRNKPSANLLHILKQSREAAGLPLNPIAADTLRSDGDDEVKKEREAPFVINESPLQEAISYSPHNDGPGYVQDTPYHAQDQVYVEHDCNEHNSYQGSWHDNKSLIECNSYMLAQEIGCDVTLIVGEIQESIQAHSFVLSSRSAKFADILAVEKHNASKLVVIPDARPDIFRLLLRYGIGCTRRISGRDRQTTYLYTDYIELSVDRAAALIPVTSVYGPTSLKTACFNFLLSEMNADNVCVTLEHAHTFNERGTYDRCMHFIFVNAVDVLKSPNFEKLCRECVENIVKSDDLNAKEFLVFEAITFWARRKCSQKRLQPTDVNIRKILDKLIFHVRFATMDVLEFTQKISHSEILDREEKISLYQFFHGEIHKLPPQFNKSNRRVYVVNHDLVTRALGKSEIREYLPDILPKAGFPVIPYKHTEKYEANLPIKKVIRFQGVNKNWHITGPDAIGFRVSTPVCVRGVQMFGPSVCQETVHVDVVIYDCHGDIVCREEKTIISEKSIKVYDVILTSPVHVPAGRTFTLQLTIRGKPTYVYYGINGLDFVKKDGVNFQFFKSNKSLNGTDITIGQIPTILFCKLENPV